MVQLRDAESVLSVTCYVIFGHRLDDDSDGWRSCTSENVEAMLNSEVDDLFRFFSRLSASCRRIFRSLQGMPGVDHLSGSLSLMQQMSSKTTSAGAAICTKTTFSDAASAPPVEDSSCKIFEFVIACLSRVSLQICYRGIRTTWVSKRSRSAG